MTEQQANIIIELINATCALYSHPQTPPRDLQMEVANLRKELIESTEEVPCE